MNFQIINLLVKCGIDYNHNSIKKYNLTETEYMILSYSYTNPDSIQDNLVKALRIDKTTLAKALQSLENKEYIIRESKNEDKRKKSIVLTEKATFELSGIIDIHDKWLKEIMSVLTDEEKENFETYCIKLLNASENLIKEKVNNEKLKIN